MATIEAPPPQSATRRRRERPVLVYSCSGCSNVAQLANAIAVRMDRRGVAEMSCIAGVGAGVKSLVHTATSGRPIVAVDGCPLACCETALARQGVTPDRVVKLHELGRRKRYHEDFPPEEVDAAYRDVLEAAADVLVQGGEAATDALARELAGA